MKKFLVSMLALTGLLALAACQNAPQAPAAAPAPVAAPVVTSTTTVSTSTATAPVQK